MPGGLAPLESGPHTEGSQGTRLVPLTAWIPEEPALQPPPSAWVQGKVGGLASRPGAVVLLG